MLPAPPTLTLNDTALFLDVDGTLVELVDDPAAVLVAPQLVATLRLLSTRLSGALALVSGRELVSLDQIFAPELFPAAGAHGAEIRLAGAGETLTTTQAFPENAWAALAHFADGLDGILVERKHGAAALHFRQRPDLAEDCRLLATSIVESIGSSFRLIAGKMVYEIAPSAHDKGRAINTFLEFAPFKGRTPVFVGDDITDEDGFAAVTQCSGTGVIVGERSDTQATFALPDVTAVHAWLTATQTASE
ncbi:MAG: trehalose-phosphatase [Pseudomonadota bacterium]